MSLSARDAHESRDDHSHCSTTCMTVRCVQVRDDGQRWPYPLYTESNGYCKCLYAPSLYPCSQDGAKMYVGEVKETAHEVYQKGRHCKGDDNDKKLMGSVVQPKQGIYPMLHLRADRQRKEDEPFGECIDDVHLSTFLM